MLGRVVKSGLSRVVTANRVSVRTLYPTYHKQLVGPPRERIGYTEKAFWGVFLLVGILAGPAWILVNLEEYKGKKA